MELQAAATTLVEAVLPISTIDVPTVLLKDIRAEAAARIKLNPPVARVAADEVIVPDLRADVTPAQSVERKLTAMLHSGAAIPVSHFRLAKLCRKA